MTHHTIPQQTFQTTPHFPHCILTIIPHDTMYNMASNHSTSLGIPQPHFTSCITAHHHSTSHHHISHLVWHCMTSHSASLHIAHIQRHTLFHITATLGWIRHNMLHLALQNIPHHTKFHTTLSTSRHVMCDQVELKCGVMWNYVVWCAVPEMWFDVKYCWDVEYITHCHCISHIIPPSLHCIIPHQTPSLTLFQTTPHSMSHHHSSSYHTFRITPAPLAAHYSTLHYHISNRTVSATLCITPHLALHPISHQVAFHITPHYMYFTPHFISHHILDTLCIAPPHLASHHILHIAPHFTCRSTSCIVASFHHIWPWSHPVTHPTTIFHITFHITYRYITTFYIPPLITWHDHLHY